MGFFRRIRKPKAQLKIYCKKEWGLGDELQAVIRVTSQEKFDVEEIGVWLKCLEEVKKFRYYQETVKVQDVDHYGDSKPREESFWREKEYWDSEILFSNCVQVKGQMKVNIDFDQSYPFTIKLPSIGRETNHSINHRLLWILKARMKIRGMESVFSQTYEVLVDKLSETLKDKVSEAVLIPCEYCRCLIHQSATLCPNCGSKRKV